MKLLIDGREYNAFVTDFRRRGRIKDGKQAGDVMSGMRVRDLIGTYYDYSLSIATNRMSQKDYDDLYETLSAPVEYHDVAFPYGRNGTLAFQAYVEDVSDALLSDPQDLPGKERRWGELTVTIRAKTPQRRP